jgi:hypothetical protein
MREMILIMARVASLHTAPLLQTSICWEGSTAGRSRMARDVAPYFPVVYMLGVAAHEWSAQGVPNSIMLEKPFAPAQLKTAVSQLLNGRSGG